jgi:hypothetical protein
MSGAARISCPMCGQPLDRGSIEEVFIEFSTLNSCGRCGFGLDLRWRGRGSALSQPTPNIVVVCIEDDLAEKLEQILTGTMKVDRVSKPTEALGIYAKTLRKETPLSAILVTTRGNNQRWSDIAVAVRALEEGFKVPTPTPLWFFSSSQPTEEELSIFEDLADIYWRECMPESESSTLLEVVPQLFS